MSLVAVLPSSDSQTHDPLATGIDADGFPLSSRELGIAASIAEALVPAGLLTSAGGEATAQRLQSTLSPLPSRYVRGYKALLWAAELSTLPGYRRPLSRLDPAVRAAYLERWACSTNHMLRNIARGVLLPIRTAHFDDPVFYKKVDCRYRFPTPAVEPIERWMRQVTEGSRVEEDLELECEVVVVGSGAGGAAAAYELASRNRAVLILEEGHYFRRRDFDGRPRTAYRNLYRDNAISVALGNVGMPVWTGRAVGGSTVINSGTCYRTPERTFNRWRLQYGLTEFSAASMAPYYERVESMLGVGPPDERYLGNVAKVIARGASSMGLRHGPITRNAPGCDGAGVCAFGCPTGAKRSTDVSYIPEALKRGAQLVSEAKVESIQVVDGRARGVTARLASGRTLKVKAQAVVIAGGALMTPLLLNRNGLCNQSGWLGRNLSIHPASKVMATFDENIDMTHSIPQSYSIEEFADEGIMFEGASVPPEIASMGIWFVGKKFTELMDAYRNLAVFGFMLQDHSRGRVFPGPQGSPIVAYNMSRADARRMQRAIEMLCEVYLAAGAKRVLPFVDGLYEIRNRSDLDKLRSMTLRPGDFEVTAYHPLGTCRIGTDPKRSCLGPDHQARDVSSLYVVDGSAVPSSLGANPQLTIMAMALRAAEIIDSRLD
ncbi:MAG: GMC family oxidoreductase [Deltaproteobacteria bacterium]|nr:GMC family oxidoreductase [Deltaproteobacteria bacterium]